MKKLQGKIVLITGGSSDIGLDMAQSKVFLMYGTINLQSQDLAELHEEESLPNIQ